MQILESKGMMGWPRQAHHLDGYYLLKKIIKATYRKHGLELTFEDYVSKQVDFLDITMNLETETYKPFKKENIYQHPEQL